MARGALPTWSPIFTGVEANGEWDGLGNLDQGEFFKAAEFGWTDVGTGKDQGHMLDNIHIAYWHRDALEEGMAPSAQGVSLTGSRWFPDGRWGLFGRLGWADGGALLEKSAAVGVTGHFTQRDDYMGVGLSWGQAFD